ncbi:MAG: trypsin-like peptidase domain-containing protein [Nannocystaceae bacterium]|nr:trypsin-like peptidase domain-containing protein [Nannocystaceae bacterium]
MSEFDIEALGVFQVFTGGGTGSGFLIDENNLLTNCHVVAPYGKVAVELRDRRRIVGTVRRLNPQRDLAVVELSTPLDFEVLPLSAEGKVRAKQPVSIIGFPVGLPLSLTEGVVSHPHQLLDGQHYLQTDAAINPGNSGGPILDAAHQIVGITTCKLTAADLVGFGIPSADAVRFVSDYREQDADFGVECPSCEDLVLTAKRYCDSCGSNLEELGVLEHFETPEPHPVASFVESALARAEIDPVLARHGDQNWSFYSGSAPIKIWCCCSEHVCFSSPLAQPGKHALGDLFRYLLSPDHAPFSFDLAGNIIRLNLTVHMSDVFASQDNEHRDWIADFVTRADELDNILIDNHGCEPAPETQLTFLKEGRSAQSLSGG